ncbi:cell division protein ZapA [Granulosicoccaceae sp. 1_MG-2023]|nr:cell division protein ZapA [Granulosicoccaceae sp. 1_MG-2023]
MSETTAIKLKFLGREIQVACKAGEKDALLRAADYVNNEMQSIKARGGNPSVEKVAIITAMNMANELLRLRESSGAVTGLEDNIAAMQKMIDAAMKPDAG